MSEDIIRKVRAEATILLIVLSISLGISSAMVGDAAKAFSASVIFSLGLVPVTLRILEFVVGLFWLSLTLKVFDEFVKIWRKRRKSILIFRGTYEAHKEEVFGALRDLIAFYRGYYGEVKKLLLLLLFTGLIMITSAVYFIHSSVFTIEEFCFNVSIGIAMIIFSIGSYRFINEKWGKKLLSLESEEKIFKDFLGEAY